MSGKEGGYGGRNNDNWSRGYRMMMVNGGVYFFRLAVANNINEGMAQ